MSLFIVQRSSIRYKKPHNVCHVAVGFPLALSPKAIAPRLRIQYNQIHQKRKDKKAKKL